MSLQCRHATAVSNHRNGQSPQWPDAEWTADSGSVPEQHRSLFAVLVWQFGNRGFMAKNRGIQTFEKRRRERDRQLKQQAKLAQRLVRKAQKRAAKLEGNDPKTAGVAVDAFAVTTGTEVAVPIATAEVPAVLPATAPTERQP